MGFNFVRKHIKVEPQRWYYWCDKLGLMVWQDMPAENSYIKQRPVKPPLDLDAYRTQLGRMVEQHRNHPCVTVWVPFNEGQGQFDTAGAVARIRKLDPSRLIDEASGRVFEGAGDIFDKHVYPAPVCPPPNATKAIVIGECGGVGLRVPGHLLGERGRSYVNVDSPDALLGSFRDYATRLCRFRDENGLSGAVFTELTDVEHEDNGLLTYDRVPKVDLARIAECVSPCVTPTK